MARGGGGFNLVCPRVGVLSLLRPGVLSRRQVFTLTHTHTHGTQYWPPGFYNTHTYTHTTHSDTRTHAHYHMHTHTHTHTQGQVHAHIQTHANTRTQKTHMLATLPVDKARHARQLVGHW